MRFAPFSLAFLSSLAIVTAIPPPVTGEDRPLDDPNSIGHHLFWGQYHRAHADRGNLNVNEHLRLHEHHDTRYKMAQELFDHQLLINENPIHVGTTALDVRLDNKNAQEYFTAWGNRHQELGQMHTAALAHTRASRFHTAALARIHGGRLHPHTRAWYRQHVMMHGFAAFGNQVHAAHNHNNAFLVQGELALAQDRRQAGVQSGQAGAQAGGQAGARH